MRSLLPLFFIFLYSGLSAQVPGFLGKKNVVEIGLEASSEGGQYGTLKQGVHLIGPYKRLIYERVLGNKFSLTTTLSSGTQTVNYSMTDQIHFPLDHAWSSGLEYLTTEGKFKYKYTLVSLQTRFYNGKKASAPLGFFYGFEYRKSTAMVKKIPLKYYEGYYPYTYPINTAPTVPVTKQKVSSISYVMGFRRILFNVVSIGSIFRLGATFSKEGTVYDEYQVRSGDAYHFFESGLYHRMKYGEIYNVTFALGVVF